MSETTPHYTDSTVTLHHGDCLDVLQQLADASVDSVVCDPPYGLSNTTPQQVADTLIRWVNGDRDYIPTGSGFMGRAWDAFVPPVAVWDECLRVLKPGGHVLAFAGSRTHDLMTMALRLAAFDIRDSVAWLYGSGFPKSLDVSKAIDKHRIEDREPMLRVRAWLNAQRNDRGVSLGQINALFGLATNGGGNASNWTQHPTNIEIPSWDKWLVLKEALDLPDEMDAEVCRLNGRKASLGDSWESREVTGQHERANPIGTYEQTVGAGNGRTAKERRDNAATPDAERWQGWGTALKPAFEPIIVARKPLAGTVAANVLAHGTGALNIDASRNGERWPANAILDELVALDLVGAPYFYTTKADADERVRVNGIAHPTVKPLDLMRWLVRLVTPPGGTVLEPFAGSGTTVEACILEGFRCIAIERESDYLPLIQQRIHRRRDPVAAVRGAGEDGGLFDLLDGGVA